MGNYNVISNEPISNALREKFVKYIIKANGPKISNINIINLLWNQSNNNRV